MEFGWFVVLCQNGDGSWSCVDAGSGGYGGWGYVGLTDGDTLDSFMDQIMSGDFAGDPSSDMVLYCLPNIDLPEFDARWGIAGWDALWSLLNEICVNENRVYGPEPDRMWYDVYPDDQAYRDLYVMKAALRTDGAYTEGLADILKKQYDYNSGVFMNCLEELTPGEKDTIIMIVSVTGLELS
jgi:hypothetical protein